MFSISTLQLFLYVWYLIVRLHDLKCTRITDLKCNVLSSPVKKEHNMKHSCVFFIICIFYWPPQQKLVNIVKIYIKVSSLVFLCMIFFFIISNKYQMFITVYESNVNFSWFKKPRLDIFEKDYLPDVRD